MLAVECRTRMKHHRRKSDESLGDSFDAFQIGDPLRPVPDIRSRVNQTRQDSRSADLFNVVESEFSRGRLRDLDESKTLHQLSIRRAMRMMTSEQLKAFSIKDAPESVLTRYNKKHS